MSPQEILTFWFVENGPDQWFKKDEIFDACIRDRFSMIHQSIVGGETAAWREAPEGRLAEILVLDQFSRNMFRGTPAAFAYDDLALSLVREAVLSGDDMRVPPERRHFFYMPYMHSESPDAHQEGIGLFKKLGNGSALKYEMEHESIIDRFGRFPHRNQILSRASTPEEIEFLKNHKGF